jgi:hypothetical protein
LVGRVFRGIAFVETSGWSYLQRVVEGSTISVP